MDQHSELANINFEFAFFQLDKAMPLNVNETDVEKLTNVFKNIFQLYQTKSSKQFNLIATYNDIHTNVIRTKAVKNALQELRDHVVFFGGATIPLYADPATSLIAIERMKTTKTAKSVYSFTQSEGF